MQDFGKVAPASRRQVDHDEDGSREVRRETPNYLVERIETSCRSADSNDVTVRHVSTLRDVSTDPFVNNPATVFTSVSG
jgi:hypothetical protein